MIKKLLTFILLAVLIPAYAIAASIFDYPKFQAFDSAGVPVAGGKVHFYQPGSSTPKDTYSDPDGAVPNANPVVLDARGESIIYTVGLYKVILKDADDVTIWTVDYFPSSESVINTGVTDYIAYYSGVSTVSGTSQISVNSITAFDSTGVSTFEDSGTTGIVIKDDGEVKIAGIFEVDATASGITATPRIDALGGISTAGVTVSGTAIVTIIAPADGSSGISIYGTDGSPALEIGESGEVEIEGQQWSSVSGVHMWTRVETQEVSAAAGVTFINLNPLYSYEMRFVAQLSGVSDLYLTFNGDSGRHYGQRYHRMGLNGGAELHSTTGDAQYDPPTLTETSQTDEIFGRISFCEAASGTNGVIGNTDVTCYLNSSNLALTSLMFYWWDTGVFGPLTNVGLTVVAGSITGRFDLFRLSDWSY